MDLPLINGFNHIGNEASFKAKKKEKIVKDKSKLFRKQLQQASNVVVSTPELTGEEELVSLMDDLFGKGEDLVKDPTLGNLRSYRNAVSLFFKFVIDNGLDFESVGGRKNPKTFEQKSYSLISIVDKKVDNIARNVLGDQQKQFDLLGAVEEINGLIIDLVS